MTADGLQFIVSSGPKLQDDALTRTLIRKQAMRNVALERRKRGNYGRVNVAQSPVLLPSTSHIGAETIDPARTSMGHRSNKSSQRFPGSNLDIDRHVEKEQASTTKSAPESSYYVAESRTKTAVCLTSTTLLSEYEITCSKFEVSVTDLSMLTNFNVGRSTMMALAADPHRLYSLLGHSQWSYLQFVPSYYGSSDCITTATDCLLARVRRFLMPCKDNKNLELRLYTKALKSLQVALQDASTCMDADVLCATQLLSLHELLDLSRVAAWSHHIQGFVRLVQHRTPTRFTSEFEKGLFAAHVGPIIFDSLMSNKPCYLEHPSWMKVYQSLAQPSDDLNDRSPLTISMRSQMCLVPGLWHKIEKAVTGSGLFDPAIMSAFESRCRKLHDTFLELLDQYKAYCVRSVLNLPSQQELSMRRELLGMSLECLSVLKRLIAVTREDERKQLETEAQALSNAILDLQKQPASKHSWLFSQHEIHVAHSIIQTKESWEENPPYQSEFERMMAVRKRYIEWTSILRS